MSAIFKECKKCDKCTNACPITEVTEQKNIWGIFFNHKIDIWNCSSCFRCEAICPFNLSVRERIFEKRRELKISQLPPEIVHYLKNILKYGNVFAIDEFTNETRIKMNLEKIDFKKIKSEMKKLLAEYNEIYNF